MKLFKITILIIFFFTSNVMSKNEHFNEGLLLYEKKKLDEAKFKFEQDLVLNPKNEKTYLYLSKIFNDQNKKKLEEKNLNTVILLNPKNEEATYNLAKLKLEQSNYSESKKMIDRLLIFCKTNCKKSKQLKIEIEKSLQK